jgi:hypothetical protein
MYTSQNFKSKKALKEAVAAHQEYLKLGRGQYLSGQYPRPVTYFQPGPFGGNEKQNGVIALEGPHYPAPHTWYAEATVENGYVVKVK